MFQVIFDDMWVDLVMIYLCDQNLSVEEISYFLVYCDLNLFYCVFQDWIGMIFVQVCGFEIV